MNLDEKERNYLACEKYYTFELLIFAAGMMGAYTFNLRGGVFCNAQTANVVLMSIALGKGEFARGFYYLIPIGAYILGSFISEFLPIKVRRFHILRWDTILIGLEMLALFLIGFLPLTLPHQIVQIAINFICSMQYNTFRQAEGVPMATTFVTNHVRQLGVALAKAVRKHDLSALDRFRKHFVMLFVFFLGGLVLTLCCPGMQERAIWLAMVPLALAFAVLAYSDINPEKEKLEQAPHGH